MGGSRDYTKRSQRKTNHMISCMWHLKYGTNEPIYETETDRHREQTCGCQGEGLGRDGVGGWGQQM